MLAESAAIAKYLADRGDGSSIYPRGLVQRALVDQHIGIINDMRQSQGQYTFLAFVGPKMRKMPEQPEKAAQA